MTNEEQAAFETRMRQLLKQAPFMRLLGMSLVCAEPDHARVRIADVSAVSNQFGGIHGGAMVSLADTCAGIAAISDGNRYVSQ